MGRNNHHNFNNKNKSHHGSNRGSNKKFGRGGSKWNNNRNVVPDKKFTPRSE